MPAIRRVRLPSTILLTEAMRVPSLLLAFAVHYFVGGSACAVPSSSDCVPDPATQPQGMQHCQQGKKRMAESHAGRGKPVVMSLS